MGVRCYYKRVNKTRVDDGRKGSSVPALKMKARTAEGRGEESLLVLLILPGAIVNRTT